MIEKYQKISLKIQNVIVGLLMIILTFVVFYQVLARLMLPFSTAWASTVAQLCLVGITYIGLAATFKQDYHIRIDLIDGFIKSLNAEVIMRIITDILGII